MEQDHEQPKQAAAAGAEKENAFKSKSSSKNLVRVDVRGRHRYVAAIGVEGRPMQWYSRPKAAIVLGS